jgi:hypothetical protein
VGQGGRQRQAGAVRQVDAVEPAQQRDRDRPEGGGGEPVESVAEQGEEEVGGGRLAQLLAQSGRREPQLGGKLLQRGLGVADEEQAEGVGEGGGLQPAQAMDEARLPG